MVQVGFKSDKGIRRRNNEDACFVLPAESVFIVADGVGGNNSGEIASRTAVSRIAEYVHNNKPPRIADENGITEYFQRCIQDVNQEIYQSALKYEENRGMATTLVLAYIDEKNAFVINIGDSRAYVCRQGEMTQITEDHSYVNTLIKSGIITPQEARVHKERNKITKALGSEALAEPDFFMIELEKDDVLLLCTDGLHGEAEDKDIAKIAGNGELTMSEVCSKLVDLANRRGGHDNITAVAVRI